MTIRLPGPRNTPQPAGGELALLLMYAFAGALALPMARAIRRNRPRTLRGWASVGTSVVFLVFVSVPPQLVAEQAEAAAPINTTFFHPDRLGSSLVVSNNTGTASATRVVYRPFGALVQNSGSTSAVPERGFTGQRFEASVGVYDYGARWYDPAIARFVQPDAYARPYDPQSLNPFSYVHNNPINFSDPTGNIEIPISSWTISFGTTLGFAVALGGMLAVESYLINSGFGRRIGRVLGALGMIFGRMQPPSIYGTSTFPGQGIFTNPDPTKDPTRNADPWAVFLSFLTMIPGVGEAMDISVVIASDSTNEDVQTAIDSLSISVITGGFSPNAGRLAKEARKSKIDRKVAAAERKAHWKNEASSNAEAYSADDLERMRQGKPPTGPDGAPMERHHIDGTHEGGAETMSKREHRLGNLRRNHPVRGILTA